MRSPPVPAPSAEPVPRQLKNSRAMIPQHHHILSIRFPQGASVQRVCPSILSPPARTAALLFPADLIIVSPSRQSGAGR